MSDRAGGLEAELRVGGTPERARHEKAYLRSELEHLGVSVPQVRAAVARLRRAEPVLRHDDVVAVVTALWARPVHECRLAGVEVLKAYAGELSARDLGLVEALVRAGRTWALVDPLAVDVAGGILARAGDEPAAVSAVLDAWARDADFWLRRSALLAFLPGLRRGAGDLPRFLGHADRMLEEREFFIRKAIGWVLRETARRRPDEVYAWSLPRAARMSGVTLREAVKQLSADQRDALLAARCAGIPASAGRARAPTRTPVLP